MGDVRIRRGLSIPEHEIELSFARSGGPGGQKVNTSATKVELRFDVDGSPSLSDRQKDRVRQHLGNRMTQEGVLLLQSSEHRTQRQNRKAAVARFRKLLQDALQPRKQRKPTKPSRSAEERRLEEKRQQAEKKRLRKDPKPPPDW